METIDKRKIHRASRGGYSLCGRKFTLKDMSMHDKDVTCETCLNLLEKIKVVDTKTTFIKRVRIEARGH